MVAGIAIVGGVLALYLSGFVDFGLSSTRSSPSNPPADVSVAIDAPATGATATTSNSASSSTGPATVTATAAEYLVGRWTRRGDCSRTLNINADGTVVTTDGTTGTWSASGALGTYALTMTAGGQTARSTVRAFNQQSFYLYPADGSPSMILTRC